MIGFVKLYRNIQENPMIMKDSDHLALWVYLSLNATHKEIDMLFKGKKITLKPGQLITGRKSLSEKLKINESKVERILKDFCSESEQLLEQQTSSKSRLLTILNWNIPDESEQQFEQEMNNKRTTSEQQVNTNKNVKNDNNEKNVINNIGRFQKPSIEEIEAYCLERKNKVEPKKFLNYYESIGWKVGKNPMKDWKAAVRTWEQNTKTAKKFQNESHEAYKDLF